MGYEHAKAPTLENLIQALGSELVGRGAEADKLQNIELISGEQPPLPKKPCCDSTPFEITRQSCDTTVPEGKSTLLEVQVVTSQDVDILYNG